MMGSRQRGLLSRLGSGRRENAPLESVMDHLRDMLNTRLGSAPSCPEYGIIDFADVCHEVPEAIGTIQQSIRATIQKFEPRLRNVSVRYVPTDDPLTIRFEVVARLTNAPRTTVRFSTALNSGGNVTVEPGTGK